MGEGKAFAAAVSMGLVAAATASTLVLAQPEEGLVPDPERGQAVVVGAADLGPGNACMACHGMDGAGDAAAAFPRLAGQRYVYLVKSLQDYASGARESAIMEPIARALSEQEMADVSAYYALQDAEASILPAPSDGLALQLGAGISAAGASEREVQACINCHGPEGAGLGVNYPYLAGQHPSYLEQQLLAWKAGTRNGDMAKVMDYIANRLNEEEISALAAYFGSLPPPEPEGDLP